MVDAPGLKQEKEVEGAGVGARVVEIPKEATASAAPFIAKRLRLSGDLKMFLASKYWRVPAWYWHSTTYQLVHHVHQLVGSCSELSRQLRWVDSYPDGAGSIWRCNGPGASLYRHQDQE